MAADVKRQPPHTSISKVTWLSVVKMVHDFNTRETGQKGRRDWATVTARVEREVGVAPDVFPERCPRGVQALARLLATLDSAGTPTMTCVALPHWRSTARPVLSHGVGVGVGTGGSEFPVEASNRRPWVPADPMHVGLRVRDRSVCAVRRSATDHKAKATTTASRDVVRVDDVVSRQFAHVTDPKTGRVEPSDILDDASSLIHLVTLPVVVVAVAAAPSDPSDIKGGGVVRGHDSDDLDALVASYFTPTRDNPCRLDLYVAPPLACDRWVLPVCVALGSADERAAQWTTVGERVAGGSGTARTLALLYSNHRQPLSVEAIHATWTRTDLRDRTTGSGSAGKDKAESFLSVWSPFFSDSGSDDAEEDRWAMRFDIATTRVDILFAAQGVRPYGTEPRAVDAWLHQVATAVSKPPALGWTTPEPGVPPKATDLHPQNVRAKLVHHLATVHRLVVTMAVVVVTRGSRLATGD